MSMIGSGADMEAGNSAPRDAPASNSRDADATNSRRLHACLIFPCCQRAAVNSIAIRPHARQPGTQPRTNHLELDAARGSIRQIYVYLQSYAIWFSLRHARASSAAVPAGFSGRGG